MPYAYLVKRKGRDTMYDLLLLVSVDSAGDTDLSKVGALKCGGTRIKIDYTTNGSNSGVPYRLKHMEIDSEGTYLDIEIQGDGSPDRVLVIAFSEADTDPAVIINSMQPGGPLLLIK